MYTNLKYVHKSFKPQICRFNTAGQTGKRDRCLRDIVRGNGFIRRDTREKTLAREVHAYPLFTEIIMAREIFFPKSSFESKP